MGSSWLSYGGPFLVFLCLGLEYDQNWTAYSTIGLTRVLYSYNYILVSQNFVRHLLHFYELRRELQVVTDVGSEVFFKVGGWDEATSE